MDPRSRLLLVFVAGIFAIVLERPAALSLLALCCYLPLLASPIGWTWRRRALIASLAVIWSTVLSQGLFYAELPRVALLRAGPLTLWREGVQHGLVQSLRFLSVSAAGLALAASTPTDRLFAALLRLRVPWALAFLAVTGLRLVPTVGGEILIVRAARARRGRPIYRRSPWAWLRQEVALVRPVVARAIRRSRRLAESLELRGFDPGAPRAVRRPLRMAPWESILLALVFAGAAMALLSRLLFVAYTSEIVYYPALRPLYGFVRAWL